MSNADYNIYANYVRRLRNFAPRAASAPPKSVRNGYDSRFGEGAGRHPRAPLLKPLAPHDLLCQ